MNNTSFIGWDIGGAHLKVANVDESGEIKFVEQYASPLWKGLEYLETLFSKIIETLPECSYSHALTITAELADIFNNREEGVQSLINIFEKSIGANIKLYSIDNGLLNMDVARNNSKQIASANWHASVSYIASVIESGIYVDVGSTTTDIIPFKNSKPSNRGFDDQSRLRFDELLYTGVIRTSLMSLTNKLPLKGEWQNIAAENFATTADIYRILSCINDDDDLMESADGKSKDIQGSIRRLARMAGTDYIELKDVHLWQQLAEYFQEIQMQLITNSILRVLSSLPQQESKIIGAGTGRFLIKKIAQRINLPYVEFSDLCKTKPELQHKCNICAPAVAVAQLNRNASLY
jgi:probable H4MPT-linked C1 transfer pathway protein